MPQGLFFDQGVFEAQQPTSVGPVNVQITLYQLTGFQVLGAVADSYLQLFSAGSIPPANGAVPKRSYHLQPGVNFGIALDGPAGEKGANFPSGCWLALSSTEATLTLIPGTASRVVVSATGRQSGA